jgi:hypothetical protein
LQYGYSVFIKKFIFPRLKILIYISPYIFCLPKRQLYPHLVIHKASCVVGFGPVFWPVVLEEPSLVQCAEGKLICLPIPFTGAWKTLIPISFPAKNSTFCLVSSSTLKASRMWRKMQFPACATIKAFLDPQKAIHLSLHYPLNTHTHTCSHTHAHLCEDDGRERNWWRRQETRSLVAFKAVFKSCLPSFLICSLGKRMWKQDLQVKWIYKYI